MRIRDAILPPQTDSIPAVLKDEDNFAAHLDLGQRIRLCEHLSSSLSMATYDVRAQASYVCILGCGRGVFGFNFTVAREWWGHHFAAASAASLPWCQLRVYDSQAPPLDGPGHSFQAPCSR